MVRKYKHLKERLPNFSGQTRNQDGQINLNTIVSVFLVRKQYCLCPDTPSFSWNTLNVPWKQRLGCLCGGVHAHTRCVNFQLQQTSIEYPGEARFHFSSSGIFSSQLTLQSQLARTTEKSQKKPGESSLPSEKSQVHHLHCSQHFYPQSSYRKAHWGLNTQWLL